LQIQRFYFCPKCGGYLRYELIDDRNRLQCQSCHYIMYENPVVWVAAIVLQEGKILLGQRNTSYAGLWCIPCGYVEWDEDVHNAARREFLEETGLSIQIERVFTVESNFHNPDVHTVGIWFLATVSDGVLQPGDDISLLAYFALDKLPPLAFPTDYVVIEKLKALVTSKREQSTLP
jgi:8-oxo-dGTP diphosphatase